MFSFFRIFAVALVAALALAAGAQAGPSATNSSLLRVMNLVRAAHGLGPLRLDPVLGRAAAAHSRELVASRTFTHGDFAGRLAGFGARGPALGENLALVPGDGIEASRQTVRMWLASPGHRANLLRPGFTRVGIAAPLQDGTTSVVTVDFAGS